MAESTIPSLDLACLPKQERLTGKRCLPRCSLYFKLLLMQKLPTSAAASHQKHLTDRKCWLLLWRCQRRHNGFVTVISTKHNWLSKVGLQNSSRFLHLLGSGSFFFYFPQGDNGTRRNNRSELSTVVGCTPQSPQKSN